MNHSASPSLSSRVTRPAYQGTCRNGEAVLSGPSSVLVWYLQLEDSDQPILPGDMPRIGEAVIWAQLGDGVAAILPGGAVTHPTRGHAKLGKQ